MGIHEAINARADLCYVADDAFPSPACYNLYKSRCPKVVLCMQNLVDNFQELAQIVFGTTGQIVFAEKLSALKSQRFWGFAIAMPIADPRNRAISETRESNDALRFRGAMEVASDLRFRAAISEPKTPSFCRISGDLAPSTRKSLGIAIARFWCAKPNPEDAFSTG